MSAAPTPDVERFAELAAAYCALIERSTAIPADLVLHEAHWRLPELYSAALRLRDVWTTPDDLEDDDDSEAEDGDDRLPPTRLGEDPDTISGDEWMRLWRSLSSHLGDRKFYREMFAPYDFEEAEPVVGDLADDLADIYRDLLRGLTKWRRGEYADAAWQWQFQFAAHWGEHTTSAIRALHALAFDHDFGPPPLRREA